MRFVLGAVMALVAGVGVSVGVGVATEVATLKGKKITLHIHPFLNEMDLTTLRLVKTNKDALKLFVTSSGGYAAMAAAPSEGFIVNGTFAPSVLAIGELPDAATAQAAALEGCEARRKGGKPCVVVLEVGPAK
jgi:hypothetical protein